MKTLLKAFLTILLFTASSLAGATEQKAPTPSGQWEGTIQLPGTSLAMQLDFKNSESQLIGSIDIPAQSMRGFPLSEIEQTDNKLTSRSPAFLVNRGSKQHSLATETLSTVNSTNPDNLSISPYRVPRKNKLKARRLVTASQELALQDSGKDPFTRALSN